MDELLASFGRVVEKLPIGALVLLMIPTSVIAFIVLSKRYGLDFNAPPGPRDDLAHDVAVIRAAVERLPAVERKLDQTAEKVESVQIKMARMEGRFDSTTPPWRER